MRPAVILVILESAAAAAMTGDSSGRAFVHLFEWSWADVAMECESFLAPKGFSAVQVSPPMEHISGDAWWTRYQPVSYKLISRSGNDTEFRDMVRRCSKVGVEIYADAVINHMAAGSGTGIAGSQFADRSYSGVPYGPDELHHNEGDDKSNCQINNYMDKHNVQYCDLVGLPDLCTGCESVQTKLAAYLSYLLDDVGAAGIRIDAAKHQDAGELGQVLQKVPSIASKKKLVFQEVISGNGEAVRPDMYYETGLVTEFNYANSAIGPNFVDQGKLQYLKTLGESWGLMPSGSAVVFLDNHDTQRGAAPLTYKSGDLYTLANVFMLSWPYGYPKVMSSYFFDGHDQGPPKRSIHPSGTEDLNCGPGKDWVCEHRIPAIANMIRWRLVASNADVENFNAAGPNTISFSRGAQAFIALNRDTNAWQDASVQTGMPAGTYCNVIIDDNVQSCPRIIVDAHGMAQVTVPQLSAVALHSQAVALPELEVF